MSMMGVAISLLQLTGFGTDPCSSMNYGFSHLTGLSFGVCQVIYSAAVLVLIIILDRKLIGFGTVANMLILGFVADLFSALLEYLLGGNPPTLSLKIGFFVAGISLFVVFVGVYASCDQGLSPYDGLASVLQVKLQKLLRGNIDYKIYRILYDGAYMLVGWLLGGETGLVTIAIVLFLGPVMEFVRKIRTVKKVELIKPPAR